MLVPISIFIDTYTREVQKCKNSCYECSGMLDEKLRQLWAIASVVSAINGVGVPLGASNPRWNCTENVLTRVVSNIPTYTSTECSLSLIHMHTNTHAHINFFFLAFTSFFHLFPLIASSSRTPSSSFTFTLFRFLQRFVYRRFVRPDGVERNDGKTISKCLGEILVSGSRKAYASSRSW